MYADRVLQILDSDRLSGMKIVFDCANGAASTVVPLIAQKLECESVLIGAEPDGLNINEKSGVMHLEALTEAVRANDADIGIAYDGDADASCWSTGRARSSTATSCFGFWRAGCSEKAFSAVASSRR